MHGSMPAFPLFPSPVCVDARFVLGETRFRAEIQISEDNPWENFEQSLVYPRFYTYC